MSNKKKLYRSRDNRMIAGVCGGLGRYFEIDPTIIRLIVVLLFFFNFTTLFLYLIAWIVIPEEPLI